MAGWDELVDEARVWALDQTMKGLPHQVGNGYERGLAPAPCHRNGTGGDLEQLPREETPVSEELPQSLHVATPKRVEENLLTPEHHGQVCHEEAVDSAVEITAGAFVSASRKKDARDSVAGLRLGECGVLLAKKLLEVLPLRSQTTGKGNSGGIFPLPTSRSCFLDLEPSLNNEELAWMGCVTSSLNSMWGGEVFVETMANRAQRRCLENILREVKRFCSIPTCLEVADWDAFFSIRSVDYKGDEVRVARSFCWANIAPALPKEVGKVPLAELCSHGSRHYVENFDLYLKPKQEWKLPRAPRVMIEEKHWPEICSGLVKAGVCTFLEESEVFHTEEGPLLNGLFGVTKDEWTDDGTEIMRLIMNLVPLNSLCRPMSGDVDTLPAWSGMSPFFLQPSQNLLVSSEDVKCFFYTLSVPLCWVKYLAFNRLVPDAALPEALQGKRVYLASIVLPMGFLNSVSLAQHVHRNLVMNPPQGNTAGGSNPPEQELRKDRTFVAGDSLWRVYLDNYELLEKVEKTNMVELEGSLAPGVLALREQYERWNVPRNFKKSVQRSTKAEVQGATVDGELGVAYPRESKLAKYFGLALLLAGQERSTQKHWQVVCGGLVYFAMFRRPLLGGLNQVWRHIEDLESSGSWWAPTSQDCILEVLRFLGCLPLARMDFRADIHPLVTCSDASTHGGGVCVSTGTTPFGSMVAEGCLRGELPESRTGDLVLSVGLFDGIGALRVALDALGVQVIGHIAVEKEAAARRVVEAHYPGTVSLSAVEEINKEVVQGWATRFSQCALVLLGAGPPCQGVSGLNCDRQGALKDARSSLFWHVPRVRELLRRYFPWCPVYTIMESVASMDTQDRRVMSEGIGHGPFLCNAGDFTWCNRPRLYWIDWEIDSKVQKPGDGEGAWAPRVVTLEGHQDISQVLRSGWIKVDPDHAFPTFTTSRPRAKPGRKPAGIQGCSEMELERWTRDLHRFPPYQYKEAHCVVNRGNLLRIPDVAEREIMLGFPLHYTAPCVSKTDRKASWYQDLRLSLLGNTWSVPVVAWFLGQLLGRLGLAHTPSAQEILDRLQPGTAETTQGRLVRLPLNPERSSTGDSSYPLAYKLGNLISIKGEDIMLTTPSTQMVKFHRLRASVPSRLWRWRVVAGWRWSLSKEHINSLELRAILTALKWRIEHQHHFNVRLIHLTDSLVCLHCLTRGRSSSRRLRRTMSRINALLLASNAQPLWGYVHTDQNPADKPSRWHRRVRTKFRNAA